VQFKPEEQPIIEPGNPTWDTVEAWATMNLERLRNEREKETADLRKLDQALGGITAMNALLGLPEQIKNEHKRNPIRGDAPFDIPPI